jgi:hypothetical protein
MILRRDNDEPLAGRQSLGQKGRDSVAEEIVTLVEVNNVVRVDSRSTLLGPGSRAIAWCDGGSGGIHASASAPLLIGWIR